MMDQLLPEIVSYVFRFLSVSDRKEAALVCKKWYYASLDPYLQRDVVFKCNLQDQNYASPKLFGRKLTHIALGDEHSSIVSEEYLTHLLMNCSYLHHLDLSFCNSLFLSGQLFANDIDRGSLQSNLSSVKELKLSCLRHMTDVTFTRLVSVLVNIQSISLASNNIIFNNNGSGNRKSTSNSPAVFNFSSFLKFAEERASKLKHVDLSFTSLNDQALEDFCTVSSLCLDELILKGCIELTDKGVEAITKYQSQLKMLDISNCKTLGSGKTFFRKIVNNMPRLHTLKARKCPHIGQCDLQSLADLPSLHTIDIGETLNLYQNDLIKGLCSCTQSLSVVQLPYCTDVSDQFVSALCMSSPLLKHLDLTSCRKITDTSLHSITRKLLSLQFLSVAYCHEISDLGLLGYVSEDGSTHRHLFEHDHETCTCTRQKESRIFSPPKGILKQHQSSITKAQTQLESGETLYKLSNLLSLKSLDLSSCTKITDLGIIEAVKFQELKNLSMEYLPKLTDSGVAHLVRSNPSLESINVRGCPELTDESVNSLCTHLPRLRSLNIAQNDKVTNMSVEILSHRCKRLRRLEMSFCGGISCDAVMGIEKSRPNLKFHFRPHLY